MSCQMAHRARRKQLTHRSYHTRMVMIDKVLCDTPAAQFKGVPQLVRQQFELPFRLAPRIALGVAGRRRIEILPPEHIKSSLAIALKFGKVLTSRQRVTSPTTPLVDYFFGEENLSFHCW